MIWQKVLFICDWDYTLMWSEVAKQMLARSLLGKASALVVGRNFYDALQARSDNPFDRVYLLQDKLEVMPTHLDNLSQRLERIEKQYCHSPLWRYVWADRSYVKSDYRELCIRLVLTFEYYEALYRAEQPDLILANAYASMPHLISYVVARDMQIPIWRSMSVRIGSHYILSDNAMEQEEWIGTMMARDHDYNPEVLDAVDRHLQQFRDRPETPAYQQFRSRLHAVTWGHVARCVRYCYQYFFSATFKNDHTKKSPWKRIHEELHWRWQRKRLLSRFPWQKLSDEPYVYFPLHVQPEMSTMTFAPYYLDQPSIIENIAKSLPVRYRLVVKEHPSMIGRRPKSYYQQLAAIPNVVLVNPISDNFQWINQADLIFTITGTAGLEGMLLGKPVIMLGSSYYKQCPLIKDASHIAPTDWPVLIRDMLLHYQSDESILRKFLYAVFSQSFEGAYVEPLAKPEEVLSTQNLQLLIDRIVEKWQHVHASSQQADEVLVP